jgi:hypothetical protein
MIAAYSVRDVEMCLLLCLHFVTLSCVCGLTFMGLSCRAKFGTDVDTLSNETPGVMSCSSAMDGPKLLLSLRCILSILAEP